MGAKPASARVNTRAMNHAASGGETSADALPVAFGATFEAGESIFEAEDCQHLPFEGVQGVQADVDEDAALRDVAERLERAHRRHPRHARHVVQRLQTR